MYQLRDYQQECLAKSIARFDAGVWDQLVVKATGTGKGVLIASLPGAYGLCGGRFDGKKMLFLVHREELLSDISNRIAKNNPTLKVGIEQGDKPSADLDCDIICAGVQTIGVHRPKLAKLIPNPDLWDNPDAEVMVPEAFRNKRIERYNPDDFAIIVVDEAHHTTGQTYQNVLKYFGVLKQARTPRKKPDKVLIGFTATPNRADGTGLNKFYSEIVFELNITQAIQRGILVDISAFQVSTEISIAQVSTRQGDFATKELERAVNTPERNALIVAKYKELGKDLPGLAFSVDVQHAKDIAAAFNAAGVSAAHVSYLTPKDERARLIAAFRAGELKILTSSSLLAEGFDEPSATVILMMRPTKSATLFCQCIGRGLRPYPSKEDLAKMLAAGQQPRFIKDSAIVIDFVDLAGKHSLNSLNSLMGIPPKIKLNGEKVLETLEEIEKITSKQQGLQLESANSMEQLRGLAEKVDLFAKPEIPPEIRAISQMAWMKSASGGYVLDFSSTKGADSVHIKENTLGQFVVFKAKNGMRVVANTAQTLAEAVKFGEAQVPEDCRGMMKINAGWANTTPSDKQIGLYSMLYPEVRKQFTDSQAFAAFVKNKYTKGQVSLLITQRNRR